MAPNSGLATLTKALIGLSAHAPRVLHRETWQLDSEMTIRGSGRLWHSNVDARWLTELFVALRDADWLRLGPPEPGDRFNVKAWYPDGLLAFVAEFGAVSLTIRYERKRIFWPVNYSAESGLEMSTAERTMERYFWARRSLLFRVRDEDVPPHFLFMPKLTEELAALKLGFGMTQKMRPGKWEEFLKAASMETWLGDAPREDATEIQDFVRSWLQEAVYRYVEFDTTVEVPFAETLVFEVVPKRPIDAAWLALAATAGAVRWPAAETSEGVYECAYPRCRKVFTRDPRRMRGNLAFCTDRHSKSYWAARRVREKREQERAAKQATLVVETDEGGDR